MKRPIAILMLAAVTAMPADFVLVWDANDEPLTASYKVYVSINAQPWQHVGTVGHPTNWFSITPTNAGLHAFIVTAVDQSGLETGPSNMAKAVANFRPLADVGSVNVGRIVIAP